MRLLPREREVLKAVMPLDLALYLRTHGWIKYSEVPKKFSIWIRKDGAEEEKEDLLLPLNPDFDDYPQRIAEALYMLAATETRTRNEVLRRLGTSGYDLLRIHIRHEGGSRLSLDSGIEVIQSTREMLLSAAFSTISPCLVCPQRIPEEVLEFVSKVELVHCEGGHIEVRWLVTPDIGKGSGSARIEPYARRVVSTLMECLSLISKYAKKFMEEGEDISLESLVLQGVSAELCAAIRKFQETTGASVITFDINWSSVRVVPMTAARVQVSLLRKMMSVIHGIELKLREISQRELNEGEDTQLQLIPISSAPLRIKKLEDEQRRLMNRLKQQAASGASKKELALTKKLIKQKADLLRSFIN